VSGRNEFVIVAASIVAASVLVELLRVVVGVALAALITSLSLRLLGIRRGWGSAMLAGVIGWSLAVVLGLGLNDWDWGADGLALHIVAVGIPTTMAVAVTLDLLARPGSLALGERAGLVVAPRPLRALRRRISVLRRYRELVRLGRREGFGPFMSASERAQRSAESTGIRLRRVLEEAGGVYIKLGQIAATRVDLLPAEVCEQLAGLQNQVAPESREDVAAVLEAELGAAVDEIFAEFEWEPLAAASIGQTHVARLRSGEPVVVKVQRPAIGELMERDLAALALLANVAQRRTQFGLGVRVGETLAQFAENLRSELDFLREADAMSEMKARLGPTSTVRVPRVHRELCTRRVLIQERFCGFTVSDTARLESSGVDREAVADQLLRTTLDQILRIGFFHADPHPGNVFVFPDGTLGLIDFGAVGRLDPIQQSAVVDIFFALSRRDVSLLRDGVERVADVTEAASPDELERSLARLMADHVRPSGSVDPQVLQDLVATLSRFGLRLPTDVVLLSRALATVDGTLRAIRPELSLMTAATALMHEPAAEQVVDRQQLVKDEVIAALPHLRRLPERIDRILTLTGRGELRVRNVVDEDRQRILRTLANRLLLSAIGAAFLLASVILLVATDDGPGVAEATGLFEIFGYGGMLVGTVLLLRVAAAVARDGTT
jgi:ubiquinone biosynthesis protein